MALRHGESMDAFTAFAFGKTSKLARKPPPKKRCSKRCNERGAAPDRDRLTIPLLCPSKQDVLVFFKGAGVAGAITADLAQKVATDKASVNKYEIVREVLVRLNDK